MAVKYEVLFMDVTGIDYKVEISTPSYSGPIIQATGSAKYGMNTVEDIRYPIRSKYLVLELLATQNDDFEDLIESDEREWSVSYYRDNQKLFFGYLTSEGVIQDYYRSERYIVFDVLDPIAFLEHLAYTDLIGSSYVGNEQLAKVIAKCLKKGFEVGDQFFDIVDFVPYDYQTRNTTTGLETDFVNGRFLKDNLISQDQYIDDDTGEIKSCLSILIEVLYSLQLCVTQVEGRAWIVYHYLHDMETLSSQYSNEYDFDGDDKTGVNLLPFSTIPIVTNDGSNQAQLLHCNENQQFFYQRGLQELLTNFEYVYRKTLLQNHSFDGGANGGAMPNWILGAYGESTNQGHLKVFRFDSSSANPRIAATSDSNVVVDVGNLVKVVGSFRPNYDDAAFAFNLKLESPFTANDYYLTYIGQPDPVWVLASDLPSNGSTFIYGVNGETTEFEFNIPEIPNFGVLSVVVTASLNPGGVTPPPSSTFIELFDIDLRGSQVNTTGVSYKTKVVSGNSLRVDKIDTYIDTDTFNISANQLIRLSTEDPVSAIRDTYHSSGFERLGAILSKNYMKAKRRRIVFTGDIRGYFDPTKYLSIPDLSDNVFIVVEYDFDSVKNVTSVKLIERDGSALPVTQTQNTIYANTIDPTIRS